MQGYDPRKPHSKALFTYATRPIKTMTEDIKGASFHLFKGKKSTSYFASVWSKTINFEKATKSPHRQAQKKCR